MRAGAVRREAMLGIAGGPQLDASSQGRVQAERSELEPLTPASDGDVGAQELADPKVGQWPGRGR